MKRVQSPSSINTYKQCPRKYYYLYNLKLPTKPSIHLVRGSVAHLALEHFFKSSPKSIDEMQLELLSLLKKFWRNHHDKFSKLDMKETEVSEYYNQTQMMLINWLNQFTHQMKPYLEKGLTVEQAFKVLLPLTEVEYRDEELMVRGYIDAIEEINGEVRLMDYKTSKNPVMSDAYKLQLGIYALMYERKHSKRPDKVGVYFLSYTPQLLNVDDELIKNAQFNIEQIHASTESDDINDYPKKQSPLCKWSTGQCDYYEYCLKGKKLPERK